MPKSFNDIVADADKRISDLQAAERGINQEINRIKDKEWTQPLSAQDRTDIDNLRANKSSVLGAIEELSFITLAALDKTDEVTRIRNALVGVVADLGGKVKKIQKIAKIATQVTQALTGIEKLQGKLAGIFPAGVPKLG